MANTYTSLHYHIVFSTKNREPWITPSIVSLPAMSPSRAHRPKGGFPFFALGIQCRSFAGLCENWMNQFPVNVGQAEVAALIFERELFVLNTQQMQNCGVKIVDVHGVADDVVAIVVGFAECHSGSDASPSHQDREASRVMITTVIRFGQ